MKPIRSSAILLATLVAIGVVAAGAPAQSIWKKSRKARSLYADSTARKVGDILTVIIQERQVIQNDESTKLEKQMSLNSVLESFDIKPDAFNTLPQVTAKSEREFEGAASYNKNGRFETGISVIVIDKLPNGNLVVEGTRDIRVDRETKRIRLSGVVRPKDISATNSVSSINVAQAKISYEGDGPLTRSTNRSWFDRLIDFLWPF